MERIMKTKIVLATVLLTSVLWGDFTLEYKMDGNMKQTVQYKDAQHVLIIASEGKQTSAQLILGDKRYMVMERGGKKKYMDMDDMMEQMKQMQASFGSMPEQSAEEKNSDAAFKIVKKGKQKTVAGIKGQVWTIEFYDKGKKERMDIVVTDDARAVDAVQKYLATMKQFMQMGTEEDRLDAIMNVDQDHVAIAFEGMKLVKFDEGDIPDVVFALPAGMDVGKKLNSDKTTTAKKPPLCPMTGKHGEAKQLLKMLKPELDGWKLVDNATCLNMMRMKVENAIYKKGDRYIHVLLSVNVEGEKGIVATYKVNDLNVKDLKRGKIQGYKYQSTYLPKAKMSGMDIRLPNAMLTLSFNAKEAFGIASFAEKAFDLSKFVPVKRSKANNNDALKSLGNIFGGQGGGSGASEADMKKAGEMLKGLFGK